MVCRVVGAVQRRTVKEETLRRETRRPLRRISLRICIMRFMWLNGARHLASCCASHAASALVGRLAEAPNAMSGAIPFGLFFLQTGALACRHAYACAVLYSNV